MGHEHHREHEQGHHAGLTGHENPWRRPEHAREWVARQEGAGRDRTEELGALVALLPFDATAQARVLELGAGSGALTGLVLERYPGASVLALDLSPIMLEEARRRLAPYQERLELAEWDLETSDWPAEAAGPFDAVVSALAIHHLERDRKAELARQVFRCLRPGGAFLNLDYVAPSTEGLKEWYARAEARLPGGEEQPHGSHGFIAGGHASGTLEEYLGDLRAAGFVHVDVFWKRLGLALTGGARPAA